MDKQALDRYLTTEPEDGFGGSRQLTFDLMVNGGIIGLKVKQEIMN